VDSPAEPLPEVRPGSGPLRGVRVVELGLTGELSSRHDVAAWPEHRRRFAEVVATRARDEWAASFAGTDACVTPVPGLTETPADPHLAARGNYREAVGVAQPGLTPRFSRTAGAVRGAPRLPGEATRTALAARGMADDDVRHLLGDGVVAG
jgi:alpha-methylacyl-CoA racemase